MMYWYGDHMTGWGDAFGTISMILFWGALIVAVIAAVRYLGRNRQDGSTPEPPTRASELPAQAPEPPRAEQMLAGRFASGEIDADEYRQRLDILRHSNGRPGKLTTSP